MCFLRKLFSDATKSRISRKFPYLMILHARDALLDLCLAWPTGQELDKFTVDIANSPEWF